MIARLGWDVLAQQVVRTVRRAGIGVPPNVRLVNVLAGAELVAALRSQHPNEAVLSFGEALLRAAWVMRRRR